MNGMDTEGQSLKISKLNNEKKNISNMRNDKLSIECLGSHTFQG